MTSRFPLTLNTGSSTIEELPSGVDLDLTGSNIVGVGNITVTSNVSVGNISVTSNVVAGNLSGNGAGLTSLTGANITGTVSSANVANNVTIVDGGANASFNYITFVGASTGNAQLRTDNTSLYYVPSTNAFNIGSTATFQTSITGPRFISNIATGTAPFTVTSTTLVANLNVANSSSTNNVLSNAFNTTLVYPTFAASSANGWGTLQKSAGITANLTANSFTATLLGGTLTTAAQPNITSTGTLTSLSVSGNANIGNVGTGILTATGNIVGASKLLVGLASTTLTNPVAVFSGSGATYSQLSMTNPTGTGSADITVYGNNGDDTQSWTDLGFTGNTFSDANYTVTAAGDGYLFTQGNSSFGGNLVIATGNTGTTKDIIFATGGFLTANIKARLYNSNGAFSVGGNVNAGNINATNIGNIAALNLTGSSTNVLYGNGVFAAPAGGSYGDSNVVTLLSSFGSNVITTTGNVSVGNIIGNGQALTGLNGSNVTGAVAYATTANSVAGANVSGAVSSATTAGTVTTAAQPNITSTGTLTDLSVSGNITVAGLSVGTLIIPQNSQSANYGIVASDSGKQILHPSADTTARTFTIPANSNVAFSTGTSITFINQSSAGNITIAITTDTMRLAGNGATGSRTLTANGVATAIKIANTEWIISGVNLT